MADLTEYTPSKGQLTFESEGQEGGDYHSRVFHVPNDRSGLTIGRGYDMKKRTKSQIKDELIGAGVKKDDAETISGAAGLRGDAAKKFIKDKKLESFEIDPDVQLKLFNSEYDKKTAYTKHLCSKPDVEETYGPCNWDGMDETLKEILIDMTYRGDYAPAMRTKIQNAVSENDLEGVRDVLADISNFGGIGSSRFNDRLRKIDQAIAVKKVDNKRN